MTSDFHRPGLHPLSHLKAGPTISSSKSTARPASSTAQPSLQTSSRSRLSKYNSSHDGNINTFSDKATITLIRRVLCPQANSSLSLEELLPPLTSSNDVDHQLYALIAIIVKEFVYSWYSKITSDQIFVNELLQVIAHCTRALEQRLRQTDVSQLVLDEIPALIEAHISSYRLAKQQSTLSGLPTSTRTIFHALNPHPGLSPIPDPAHPQSIAEQCENESSYRRLLMYGTLAVLLPTEDLENSCLRTLLVDILADLILGKEVSGKICERWFLWETIAKLVEVSQQDPRHDDKSKSQGQPEDRLRKFGLLSTEEEDCDVSYMSQSRISMWIWSVLQYAYVTFLVLRFIATGLFRVASRPQPTTSRVTKTYPPSATASPVNQRPVLDFRLFSMVSELLAVPQRMPWLRGLLALFQHLVLAGPGRLGDADSTLDRFLYETIQDYVLTPALLPHLLLASRTALFPVNVPAPQGAEPDRAVQLPLSMRTPTSSAAEGGKANITNKGYANTSSAESAGPSAPEIAAIRRHCAVNILALIPRPVARRLFGVVHNSSNNSNHRTIWIDDNDQINSHGYNNGYSGHNNTTNDSQKRQESGPTAGGSDADREHGAEEDEDAVLVAAIENELLDMLEDEYCNKHLVYSIIETVLVRLVPELGERSVGELLEDRGVCFSNV